MRFLAFSPAPFLPPCPCATELVLCSMLPDVFAHLTLEAPEDSVARCIKALNRSAWFSSILRVERANEHYLQRAAREAGGGDGTVADVWEHDDVTHGTPPISQLRVSDTSLPRGKRWKNRILVSLEQSPSSSHSHFDNDGVLVSNHSNGSLWSKLNDVGRRNSEAVGGPSAALHAASASIGLGTNGSEAEGNSKGYNHGYRRGVSWHRMFCVCVCVSAARSEGFSDP